MSRRLSHCPEPMGEPTRKHSVYLPAKRGQDYVMRTWKYEPYAHQLTAYQKSKDAVAYALHMDMRTGKTKVIYDTFGHLWLSDKVDLLFVLAPKGAYHAWPEQYHDYHDGVELQQGHLNIAPVEAYDWVDAPMAEQRRIADLINPAVTPPEVPILFFMNIEALSMSPKAIKVAKLLVKRYRCLMVIDESTCIKTPKAKCTKTVTDIGGYAEYRRTLTGTPATKNSLDLYSQYAFLDKNILGYTNYFSFRKRYARLQEIVVNRRTIQTVVGVQRTDELRRKIAPYTFRVTKDEAFDMPKSVYQKIVFELSKEAQVAYKQMREHSIAVLDDSVITAPLALTQMQRLQQIACGFLPTADGVSTFPDRRIPAILDLIESVSDEKIIIWCAYRISVAKLTEELQGIYGAGSVVNLIGGQTSELRTEAVASFRNPKSAVRFVVGTAQSGGMGTDLRPGSLTIYHSNTPSLKDRLQSEDRPRHPLNAYSVGYVDFIAKGTIDEKWVRVLQSKKNIADELTGDAWKEWL